MTQQKSQKEIDRNRRLDRLVETINVELEEIIKLTQNGSGAENDRKKIVVSAMCAQGCLESIRLIHEV
jgi:hypothetical protein